MSLAQFPAAVLETIVTQLAALFLIGAGGDMEAARQATRQMLAAYHPETEDELCLAAHIVGFTFQTLQALGEAAETDTPATRALRLRSGAVSLSRQGEKAQRSLARLQKARKPAPVAETQPETAQPTTITEAPPAPIQARATTKATGQTWTKAYQDRQRAARIAANLKRAEARFGMSGNAPAAISQAPTMAQTI